MIIGKNKQTKMELDLNKLISTRLLVQANSGGGKSWLLRKILEESHGKVQQIILDLEGEFSTLRERYDYLLVGRDGEIPCNIKTAQLLSKKILELNVSTIIDLSELKHHERITFVKRFLDGLLDAPRKLWHPALIVVDEAHQFCPQASKSESASSVIDLMTRGRKRGFCGILATQRISKLHKDACAEANNKLIGRTGLDIDRKRASEELGFNSKEDAISLRYLEPGEFYAFGPAISKEVIKFKVGDVKTTHPEPGRSLLKPSKTPDNIKKLLKDVIDLPKEVEEELKTKNDFLNKINELKRDLRKRPKEIIKEEKVIEIADKEKLEMAYERGAKDMEKKYDSIIKSLEVNARNVGNSIKKLVSDGVKILESKSLSITSDKPIIIVPEFNSSKKERNVSGVVQHNGEEGITHNAGSNPAPFNFEGIELGICAKKIYSFLYNNSEKSFSKHHIGAFTGYSHRSGGFNNAISQLNRKDLIIKNGTDLQVKEMNSNLAEEYDFSKEAIMKNLGVCPKKIYQMLLDNPYQEFSKEEIGESTGYSHGSGGFNNAISKLNSLGLIIKNNSILKLNPELLE